MNLYLGLSFKQKSNISIHSMSHQWRSSQLLMKHKKVFSWRRFSIAKYPFSIWNILYLLCYILKNKLWSWTSNWNWFVLILLIDNKKKWELCFHSKTILIVVLYFYTLCSFIYNICMYYINVKYICLHLFWYIFQMIMFVYVFKTRFRAQCLANLVKGIFFLIFT